MVEVIPSKWETMTYHDEWNIELEYNMFCVHSGNNEQIEQTAKLKLPTPQLVYFVGEKK